MSNIGDILKQVGDQIVRDGLETGEQFWTRLSGDEGRIEQSKQAMARYAGHNLSALADPENRDQHIKSAAHDLNTLTNLASATQVEARREAREYTKRVFASLLNITETAIGALL